MSSSAGTRRSVRNLPRGHLQLPAVLAGRPQTVYRQIDTLAHAHARGASDRFGMPAELELIESDSLLQYVVVDRRCDVLLPVGDTLAERETLREFDEADQVAAATAAVTVKQILAGIDIKRGLGFRV